MNDASMIQPTLAAQQEIEHGMAAHPARKGLLFNLAVTVLEVGGAILVFHIVKANGGGDVGAYLAGSLAPILGALVIWIRARKFSGASAAIFAFAVLSALVAIVGSTEPKVLLYKDCGVTAAIGLIFGLSCIFAPRPVLFYFAQRYGTDGTRDGMAVFDKMWVAYDGFRRSLYQISALWAVVFLVQAGVTAAIIAATPFSTGYNYDQILPIVAFVLAGGMTVVLSAKAKRAGAARAIAARERSLQQ
ncbi:hypothetical protein ABIB25_004868 [Nakamurella sp. UYEF19]|uniref:VC0807 family protein n=1 Tax=Nakamurella sp. UYEF19 TaxID=1756392 RepID=UPI003391B2F5